MSLGLHVFLCTSSVHPNPPAPPPALTWNKLHPMEACGSQMHVKVAGAHFPTLQSLVGSATPARLPFFGAGPMTSSQPGCDGPLRWRIDTQDAQDAQILDYLMQIKCNKSQKELRQRWEAFLTELDVLAYGASASESSHWTVMCANLLCWLLADDGRHSI